jgi:hypothetical protein
MPPLFPPVANPLLPPQQEQLQFAPIPAPLQAPQGEQRNEKMANIGGLLLNVLGALSGAGAAGNGLLSQGQQIQEQRAKREGQMATLQSREAIAEKMNPQGKQIRNKDARGVFGERLAQRDIEGAEQVLNSELSRQRMEDAERDRNKKDGKDKDKEFNKMLSLYQGQLLKEATELDKAQPAEIKEAEDIKRALENQFRPEDSRGNIKTKLLNAKALKGAKDPRANTILQYIDEQLKAKSTPKMLGGVIPWGSELPKNVKNSELFKDLPSRLITPEAQQAEAMRQGEVGKRKQFVEAIRFVQRNYKTKDAATREQVQKVLGTLRENGFANLDID